MGFGFLIGHAALAVLMPLALVALARSYRSHRHPLPLGLGALAAGIGYVHIIAGTPEWTLYFVLVLSGCAAVVDWLATGPRPLSGSARLPG